MDNEALQKELDLLKKKIKIQWGFIALFFVVVVACAFNPSQNGENLTVRSLNVIDNAGKVRVKIGIDPVLDAKVNIHYRQDLYDGLIY
ncbi:MAG: hypothetical protein QME64_03145, partial [bacterium]|nr:hypothetical protein [bacterium]